MEENIQDLINVPFSRDTLEFILRQIRESLSWINAYNQFSQNKISEQTITALNLLDVVFSKKLMEG